MADISFPKVNASLIPETPTISVEPKVTTIIGQMTSGTATSGVRLTDIDVNSQDGLFGPNSQVTAMIDTFRSVNLTSQLDIIPFVDNGSGVAATGTIAFTGTITTAGSIIVNIGNKDRTYKVDVVVGDTAALVGDKLEALITADVKALVTASNTTGSVALTAVNAGTVANKYTIAQSTVDAIGVTVTITAFSGGATDPVITNVEDLLVDRTDVVIPNEYDFSAILSLLDSRFNANNAVLDGRLITASTDTKTNLVNLGNTYNSQSLVIFGDEPVDLDDKKGSAILNLDIERAAHFAGLRTLRLEDGTQIADFITSTEPLDNIGGVHTSTLPYANTATLLAVIPTGQGFNDTEVDDLTDAGISVMGNNIANNTLILGEALTTYKTNIQGFEDETYKFLNYVDTATAAREFIWKSLKNDYAQSRLTLGQAVPGYKFATIGGVRASFVGYHSILSGEGYVLLQGGILEDGRSVSDILKANLTVSFDIKSGEIVATSILPLVTQVRIILAPLNIRFNVNEISS